MVLDDLGTRCGVSTERDSKTIAFRVEHEGLSFLTITLPKFGKDFERSLDQGFVGDEQFYGFRKTAGLPHLLGGFLRLVFNTGDGRLLDDPSHDAIYAIRQISLMFAKIALECTPEREQHAYDEYIECEKDVRLTVRRLLASEPDLLEAFSRIGRLLWADVFSMVDTKIYQEFVVPKHGPGATADKLRGNAKYNQLTWTRRLDEVFPHWEHLIPSESFLQRMDSVCILEPWEEIPVRVISVPKTLETPRIIAVEPTCMQYMQQGVLAVMKETIPRFDNSREFVQFERQEPNQRLALEGSITGALATLDLSEASDRVSTLHVQLLLENHRLTREAVFASRSWKARVPGHGVISLAKFASMGSALCFPFEAMVFATAVFVGIEQGLSRRLTKKDIQSFYGRVRVYGDDIIVPVDYANVVISTLEAFGFRVNRKKSFWTGKFRESCGRDYYDGTDVSIVRVRRLFAESRSDAEEVVSMVSLRNQLYERGFCMAVDHLDTLIERLIPFPVVSETSPLLGRLSAGPCQPERSHPTLHHPLVKGAKVESVIPESNLDDYGALLKWFLHKGSTVEDEPDIVRALLEGREIFLQDDHLLRAGRPRSIRIKTGWGSPY